MNVLFILKICAVAVIVGVLLLTLSLFELKSQVSRYKNYWERNNEMSAQTGEILYVALGDSTAQGIGASHPSKGYTGIISKKLAIQESKPVRLVNLSKSGAKVKDVSTFQIPDMQKLGVSDKTVITISVGANNMTNFNPEVFESDMDELMSKLPYQTVISDIPYFGQSRFGSKENNVQAANKIMNKLAERHNFKLAPLYDRMKNNGGIKTFAADLFHPSNYAYRENWAPVFLEQIQIKQ